MLFFEVFVMSFFKGWEDFRLHALSEVIGLVLSISRRLRPAHLGEDGAAAAWRIDNRHDTVLRWDPARSERGGGRRGGRRVAKKKRDLIRRYPSISPRFAPCLSSSAAAWWNSVKVPPPFRFSKCVSKTRACVRVPASRPLWWWHMRSSFNCFWGETEKGKKNQGSWLQKQQNHAGVRVLLFSALLSHTHQIRASKWKEKCLFFQTHSTNVDGIRRGNEPLKINRAKNIQIKRLNFTEELWFDDDCFFMSMLIFMVPLCFCPLFLLSFSLLPYESKYLKAH